MLASFSSRQTYPGSSKFQQKALCQASHVLMNISGEIRWSRRSQVKLAMARASVNVRSCGALTPFRLSSRGDAHRWSRVTADCEMLPMLCSAIRESFGKISPTFQNQFAVSECSQKFAGDTLATTVKRLRAVSSVVEHLVYTERVGGSKPSPPNLSIVIH